jgi:hypothetical protein
MRHSTDDPDQPVTVFDGAVARTHTPAGLSSFPGGNGGQGRVFRHNSDFADVHLRPVWLVYRPLHPKIGKAPLTNATLTGREGLIDGHRCVLLEEASAVAGVGNRVRTRRLQWWVDPRHPFCLRRHLLLLDDKVLRQLDLSYVDDARDGLQLGGWRLALYNGKSQLTERTTATVTSREINPQLDPDEFRLDYSPGTVVWDTAGKEWYVQKEGDSRRVITTEERARPGVTVEELLRTEPGMAGLPPARPRTPWRWVAIAAANAALLLVGVGLWLRHRRRAATPPGP